MTVATSNSHPRVKLAINQAYALDENGQSALAVSQLTTLLEEFPDSSALHAYLSWFLRSERRLEEAVVHSRQAIELSPRSEKASLSYFYALWDCAKYIEALDEMARLLKIRPSEIYSDIIKDWKLDEDGDEVEDDPTQRGDALDGAENTAPGD